MPKELGGGLIMRWSTAEDTEHIAAFTASVFRRVAEDHPLAAMADTVRRLMADDHLFMGPTDFLLIEDTGSTGSDGRPRLIACSCHLQEDWTYAGIPLPVGRPEIVASDPEYRNRGLIRTIFTELHDRCAAEGRLVQGITGIPYFYRQFGYEYALDLGGFASLPLAYLPAEPASDDGAGGVVLRRATFDDIEFMASCYRTQQAGSLVSVDIPDAFWRSLVEHEDRPELPRGAERLRVITDRRTGEALGFLMGEHYRDPTRYVVMSLNFLAGLDLRAIAPSLLHETRRLAEELPVHETSSDPAKPLRDLEFKLGRDHPFYRALSPDWVMRMHPPYAWYLRVPDLPAFLRHIAPALEARLVGSPFAGFSGEIALDFYRGGLKMAFESGRLKDVADHRYGPFDKTANAGFPPLTFLRMVFGQASLDEMRAAYPDVWAKGEYEDLLQVLFPKLPSRAIGL